MPAGAAWEREPRTGEPVAFLPNEGLCETPPGCAAKPPESGRLVPTSLPPVRIPPALGLCRVEGFLCVLRPKYKPQIKFRVFSFAELGFVGQWFFCCLETSQFGGGLLGGSRYVQLGNVSRV